MEKGDDFKRAVYKALAASQRTGGPVVVYRKNGRIEAAPKAVVPMGAEILYSAEFTPGMIH